MEHNYKSGELIEVRDNGESEWVKRFFIGFTKSGCVITENSDGNVCRWDHHRPIPQKKKRLMTAKELAGKWVKMNHSCIIPRLVTSFHPTNEQIFVEDGWFNVLDCAYYTDTPSNDNSWKSVEVEE